MANSHHFFFKKNSKHRYIIYEREEKVNSILTFFLDDK